jgi:hypothetical protein
MINLSSSGHQMMNCDRCSGEQNCTSPVFLCCNLKGNVTEMFLWYIWVLDADMNSKIADSFWQFNIAPSGKYIWADTTNFSHPKLYMNVYLVPPYKVHVFDVDRKSKIQHLFKEGSSGLAQMYFPLGAMLNCQKESAILEFISASKTQIYQRNISVTFPFKLQSNCRENFKSCFLYMYKMYMVKVCPAMTVGLISDPCG